MVQKEQKGYWERLWTVGRWFKAFIFACTIGLGYYLGNMFFSGNWFVGLLITTIFLALAAGNLLDVLFPEK